MNDDFSTMGKVVELHATLATICTVLVMISASMVMYNISQLSRLPPEYEMVLVLLPVPRRVYSSNVLLVETTSPTVKL